MHRSSHLIHAQPRNRLQLCIQQGLATLALAGTLSTTAQAQRLPEVIELSALNDTSVNAVAGLTINAVFNAERLGQSLSSVGDINGDGTTDLMVGASVFGPYVIFGSSDVANPLPAIIDLSDLNGSGANATTGIGIRGAIGDQLTTAVSNAGDMNGNGVDDLLIGTAYATTVTPNSGRSICDIRQQ